jgi:hypothetical protein
MATASLDFRPLVVMDRRAARTARQLLAVAVGLMFHVKRGSRRAGRTLYVTVDHARPYALTVGGLACLTVGAFTVATWLGWTAAGTAALLFNWGLHKE